MVRISRLVVFSLTTVLLTLSWSTQAQAYQRSIGREYNVVLYWKILPVPFMIHRAGSPNTPSDPTYEAIRQGFQIWTNQTCTCFKTQYNGLTSSQELGYDTDNPDNNINIVLFRTTQWGHAANAVAITSTIYNQKSGEILAFDMELNNVQFHFSLDGKSLRIGNKLQPTIDIQNTVTHEAGHVLGLDHSSSRAATMYASAPPGETAKRDLDNDDIQGLCTIYTKNGSSCQIATNGQDKQGCACSSNPSHTPPANLFLSLALLTLFLLSIRIAHTKKQK